MIGGERQIVVGVDRDGVVADTYNGMPSRVVGIIPAFHLV
jgi:hypothetical protein